MTTPIDSHCSRCLTPAPAVESPDFLDWEASSEGGSDVVCPDCITPAEQQEMDEQGWL